MLSHNIVNEVLSVPRFFYVKLSIWYWWTKKVVPDTNIGIFIMEKPQNYLGKAIAGVILCWPFGLPGIINAAKVNSLWDQGRLEEAVAASESAAKWSRVAIILGIISAAISLVVNIIITLANA